MTRFDRLLQVAKCATPERLERVERILYPYAAQGMQEGKLLDSQLEVLLKAVSTTSGASIRAITKAYRAVAKANPERHQDAERAGPYLVENGCFSVEKDTRDGPVTMPLCNFTARITEERERDDGVELTRTFVITGGLANGRALPEAEVAAPQFAAMNWPVAAWGTRAVVYAGQGTKDHLRAAVQMLSGDVPRRVTYTHLGWREIEGRMVYLHAGGVIAPAAPDAPLNVQVETPQGLERFILPEPPTGDALVRAVRASFGVLDLGPRWRDRTATWNALPGALWRGGLWRTLGRSNRRRQIRAGRRDAAALRGWSGLEAPSWLMVKYCQCARRASVRWQRCTHHHRRPCTRGLEP